MVKMKALRLSWSLLASTLGALLVDLPLLLLALPGNLLGLWYLRHHLQEKSCRLCYWGFPAWLWLWDNEEDGVGGPWEGRNANERRWCDKARNWPLWRRILSWNLLRNPVTNLRWTPWGINLWDNPRIEQLGNCRRPDKDFDGTTKWLWSRVGWRGGVWIVWPSKKWTTITCRFGWTPFVFDPHVDKREDAYLSFKLQPMRRGEQRER